MWMTRPHPKPLDALSARTYHAFWCGHCPQTFVLFHRLGRTTIAAAPLFVALLQSGTAGCGAVASQSLHSHCVRAESISMQLV